MSRSDETVTTLRFLHHKEHSVSPVFDCVSQAEVTFRLNTIIMKPYWSLLAVLLLICALTTSTFAMKHSLAIKRDHRTHFLIEKFGFTPGGQLQLNVTNVDIPIGPLHSVKAMGLVITVSKAEFVNYNFQRDKCPFALSNGASTTREEKAASKALMITYSLQGSTMLEVNETVKEENAGLWSLYWVVCSTQQPKYSFNLKLEQWNVLPNGKRSYLPTGELPLPYIYGTFVIITSAMFLFWIGYFMCAKNRKVNTVHYMMTILLFFKLLALFCQTFMYGTMAKSGDAQGWNIAYYVFQSARAVALFTVVLMIGTGFTFLKAFLTDSDKRLFFIVLPAQVLANVALIITEETMPGSNNWIVWLYIFRAVDIICCAAVLFPIVNSMNSLKSAAQTDGKARASLEKLVLFRRFYLIVICYIYFTRIIVLLLNSTLPYSRAWVGPFFAEFAAVCFYLITGHQFRPIRDNPYFQVDQDESDLIELRAREAIQNEEI
jgi:hypothetical protein